MSKNKTILALYLILTFGFLLRIVGINWDMGHHMHPDERAITLAVANLSYPESISEFLTPDSRWNPKFFAYGNFPFYLLRIAADAASNIDPLFALYDQINIVGRFISAIFDLGTILMIFFIGRNLKNSKLGLTAAFIYSISVLPIQLSHFYAVDTILTFFITTILFLLLKLYDKPSLKFAFGVGIFLGLALATKISVTVILSSILLALSMEFVLIFLKTPHKPSKWVPHLPKVIKQLLLYGGVIISTGIVVFSISQPYALIDSQTFIKQITEQSLMTKDPFTFPYTLQYVGKIPYFYELKNITLFGLGPVLGILSILGIFYTLYRTILRAEHFHWQKMLILLQFFLTYFLITGAFAIGFMRYMLPIYPLLAIFSAVFLVHIFTPLNRSKKIALAILLAGALVWPLSFVSIYLNTNSRVAASDWIYENIEQGSTIATEHWDDVLPLSKQENYTILSLPLYEPETADKWEMVNNILSESDYIILASNRLYIPLSKLTDCPNLPPYKCYVKTSLYYKELFSGKNGFTKVAEISSSPTIPFTDIKIDDQSADESFTVYDHPKIIIFKKDQQQENE